MEHYTLYIAGSSPALTFAVPLLSQVFDIAQTPNGGVTHLLLPVPAFDADGMVKGGQSLEDILSKLPGDVTVIGGNLAHPGLDGHQTVDLLKDPFYVAKNAAITAHCALKLILSRLPVTLSGQRTLIIGWGRIGKCLADLLQKVGAAVTVAARKDTDRAMAQALGFAAADPAQMDDILPQFRIIVNTAPAPVLSEAQSAQYAAGCLKIDLASKLGISGDDVVWARGLPGKDTPETSGTLIAETVIRLISGKEQTP